MSMAKIIKGKRYNTESASLLVSHENPLRGQEERLYRKKTGEYFLLYIDYITGERIAPLTAETLKQWAISRCGPDFYTQMLDSPPDTISHLSFRVSHSEAEKLKQYALKHNKSQLTVIRDFISAL